MIQPSLFDATPTGPYGRPSMEAATAARDEALAKVEETAPTFIDDACSFAIEYLRTAPEQQASAEAITDACLTAGIVPRDLRAFGAVYARLRRQGKIIKTGECLRQRGHGTAGGTIWRLAT